MFFGYPIAATSENWLHDALVEMVTTIHANIKAGAPPTAWPIIIPAAHRAALRKRTGLRDRLGAYRDAISGLTDGQRDQIEVSLVQQNRIGELCRCEEDCESIEHLPEACRAPIRDLFGFAFDLLTDSGVRDRQYKTIYDAGDSHVCPFCGCEYFDAPGAPREDFDHYLPRSRYPFAATNLRNLVPMGMKCNQRYKSNVDILRDAASARRRAFDPYTHDSVEVSLIESVPFAGADDCTPDWVIDFEPDSPECSTWDSVFQLRVRITRDVLDPSFFRWLRDFAVWFDKRFGDAKPDSAAIQDAMRDYVEDLKLLGFNAREFLRASVFQMLHVQCANGNDRLNTLMVELVS